MNTNASILVLEDEAIVAMELESQLTEFGYRVLGPVATTQQALALAERFTPDLLLADIRLGNGEEGTTVAAILRDRFGVPTLYLSAHSDPVTVERALAADPFGFLTKPFRAADLRTCIAAALRRSKLERRLAERERELALAHARTEQALEAVSASEARFRAVFEGSPDAILLVERSGRVTMANPAAIRLFGEGEKELHGIEVEQLVPEGLRHAHRDQRASFFQLPRARIMGARSAVYTRNFKGKEIPLEIGLSALDIGGARYALVIARDVSERKRHEEQIAKLRKLDALGRLASGVAHDFNNMVTVILGIAGVLDAKLADRADAAVLLHDIREASQRAGLLTRQLMTFARRLPAAAEALSLNAEIQGFRGLLARALIPRCSLVVDLDADPCRVTIDPAHLQQVLLNLVVNARDAMPNGGVVCLRTRAHKSSPSGVRCSVLEVQDEGTGMSEEVKGRLFEPLFTTKAPGEGTGLGLSTVYGIVMQAGGDIAVESSLGQGSTFRIWLPEEPVGQPSEPTADNPLAPG